MRRLQWIEPTLRIAGADRAEAASARAHRPHQHQGGGATAPAFGDVGAFGLRTHRVQLVVAHHVADGFKTGAGRKLDAQPRWLAVHIRLHAVGVGADTALDCTGTLRTDEFAAVHGADGNSRSFVGHADPNFQGDIQVRQYRGSAATAHAQSAAAPRRSGLKRTQPSIYSP